jgi:hypothetical protein
MRVRSWLSIVLVACARASLPPPAPAPSPPPRDTCAHVADHLLSLLSETAREAPPEELDRVRAAFGARCEQDGWSVEARRCFVELTRREDVDRCASLLTEDQQQALGPAA